MVAMMLNPFLNHFLETFDIFRGIANVKGFGNIGRIRSLYVLRNRLTAFVDWRVVRWIFSHAIYNYPNVHLFSFLLGGRARLLG